MIVPATRYADCDAAIAFLRDAFGLEEHAVYRDEAGAVVHAEMTCGTGLVMFGPRNGGVFGRHMVDPSETGGRETTTIYAVVNDVAARYERAKAAGATILRELQSEDYGGQSFSAADAEGHIWTFGDYDPRAEPG